MQCWGKNETLYQNAHMKITSLYTLLTAVTIGLSLESCCKGYCSDEDIFAIDFLGFTPSDMQKIKIISYGKGSPSAAIDSFYVSTNNIIVKDTTRVFLDKSLKVDSNYKIAIENAGLSYSISDFITEKEDCNCGSGSYKKIAGYNLNGMQYAGSDKYKPEIRKWKVLYWVRLLTSTWNATKVSVLQHFNLVF